MYTVYVCVYLVLMVLLSPAGYVSGVASNQQTRQIVLPDGSHVTYDNGLRIIQNPQQAAAATAGAGEYQLTSDGRIRTTAQHHSTFPGNTINDTCTILSLG